MLTSKGLLSICEDHQRPLRACFQKFMGPMKPQETKNGPWKLPWRRFLKKVFGEEKACVFPECSKVPAIYWVGCPCQCGLSQRVCRRHRSYRTWCSDVNVPPNGTGTVYRQQVKKI